jgi:hypothetical protein
MSPREERAVAWVKEWAEYQDESLTELLERFALHEIAVWRHDNLTPGGRGGGEGGRYE